MPGSGSASVRCPKATAAGRGHRSPRFRPGRRGEPKGRLPQRFVPAEEGGGEGGGHGIGSLEGPDVVDGMGAVDPVRDHDVITSELALADLAVVERRLDKTRKSARAGDKEAQLELVLLDRVVAELNRGRGAREPAENGDAITFLRTLGLLTAK